MEGKHIVTVDLGTRKLGISVCRIDRFGIAEVISYDEYPSKGISHGKVLNPTRLSEALRESLGKTAKFLGSKISGVLVNLQKFDVHQMDFSCQITKENSLSITREDLEALSSKAWEEAQGLSEGEEVFGLVAQCFETEDELGVSKEDIVGMVSSTLKGKYKVFLGKSSMRSNIEEAFHQAGISNVKTLFAPDKVGAACLTGTQMDGGVALIDIGAGASSVSVFYGGTMRHYGAIPFGGDCITSDIRSVCGIEDNLAENIKMGYGGCMPDRLGSLGEMTLKIGDPNTRGRIEITTKYLSEIITARMKEILDALMYEIQISGFADKLKNGIIVVGAGASMMNLCLMIRQNSGYSAKIGAPLKNVIKSGTAVIFHPGAAASAGLVLDCSSLGHRQKTDSVQIAPVEQPGGILAMPPEEENVSDEIFNASEVESAEPAPKAHSKESQKIKHPKPQRRFADFFKDTLFGEETDKDNEL